MAEILLSERVAERVQLVTLNRPDALNAINSEPSADRRTSRPFRRHPDDRGQIAHGIAVVSGPEVGFALALTLASDLRFAARSAVLRAAFITIGVSNCDTATSWRLPRLIGADRLRLPWRRRR